MKLEVVVLSLFLGGCMYAQNDSLQGEVDELEELVISAQIEPQSVKKSVNTVRVITREDIENRAAVNLADILNQYLKINVVPDRGQGRSTVSLFGLDGQYLKVLIDNIPVVSDSGIGNNVDLTQINLNDIERIEIVEGSMGVTHGGNTVSGIVNIITKRKVSGSGQLNAFITEETVGKEYGLFNKGRHIQNIKISKNFADYWYASLGTNHTWFSGFYNDRIGNKKPEVDTEKRGYDWLPKRNWVTSGVIAYNKDDFHVFYKADYLTEKTEYYNPKIRTIPNYPFEPDIFTDDRDYETERIYHHLNVYGQIPNSLRYNVSVSFQRQVRDFIDYRTYLYDNRKDDIRKETYQKSNVWYSTGQFSNFFKSDILNMQLGYELSHRSGFASGLSGLFKDDNNASVDISKEVANYDIYGVWEYMPNNKLTLRPGARYSIQSQFKNQYAYSLGARYNPSDKTEIRGGVGRSFRTPNFDELYTYYVDSNHDFQGNKDLIPERSAYAEFSVKYFWKTDAYQPFHTQLSASYLSVEDKISNALVETFPNLKYKYININAYKVFNATLENVYVFDNGEAKLDFSILGISQEKSTGVIKANTDFLFTPQASFQFVYTEPFVNTKWALYYKYQGKAKQYVEQGNDPQNMSYVLSETEDASWVDLSVSKKFWNNRFWLTLGVRNLLNITTLRTSLGTTTGVHAEAIDNSLPMSYGRSYFLKLEYQLNF